MIETALPHANTFTLPLAEDLDPKRLKDIRNAKLCISRDEVAVPFSRPSRTPPLSLFSDPSHLVVAGIRAVLSFALCTRFTVLAQLLFD